MIPPRANPDLFGQSRPWEVLLRGLRSGRTPHAWLLAGPRGVGKATLAHRFTRALLAPPGEVTPAASRTDHPTFRQCAADAHPDLFVLEPPQPAKAGRTRTEIGVDAVRDATRSLHRTVVGGGYRVLIVDGAEALNRNAANALLKPLEEPPPATVILLISHDPFRLLPTIRSRCAVLRAARLEVSVIERILAAQAPEVETGVRAQAAQLAHGSVGRAFDLANSGLAEYRSLVLTLGTAPVDAAGLHELAEALRRRADLAGGEAVAFQLQLLLARLLATASGRPAPPLFDEEPAALQRLAARRPLEQWPVLWEKVARLLQRADALNLDRAHVLLLVLGDLANAVLEEAHAPASPVPGDLDAAG